MYSEEDVCRQCGLAPYILRYWQMHFPELKGEATGYKTHFSANDIALVWRIKKMLYIEHLTVEEAQRRLRNEQCFPVCDPGRAGFGPQIGSTQTMRVVFSDEEQKKAKAFEENEKIAKKQRAEKLRQQRIERVKSVIEQLKALKDELNS